MKYSIHNPDNAELLVRFMAELEKAGYTDDDNGEWNKYNNPINECDYQIKAAKIGLRKVYFAWILISFYPKVAMYTNHKSAFVEKHINLTEENFDEVLKEVLQ